jgi:hypothetical protein
MAELLHHQDKVVSMLCTELKTCDPISMGSFFDLIAVLCRDLQDASMKHFHELMKTFVAIMNTVAFSGGHSNENAPNPELTGKLFETIGHLLKACLEHISENPQELSSYYGSILGNSIEFVRSFGAKTFSIVVRKMKLSTFTKHMKKVFKALAHNMNLACDGNLGSISLVEVNDSSKQDISEEKRSKWLIHGMSRLLYVTFKGIKGEMHSKAVGKIKELFSLFSSCCLQQSKSDIEDLFYVKSVGSILCRCLHLLHFHLFRENQKSLVVEEVAFLEVCTCNTIVCNDLKLIAFEFSRKLLLMMLTINHGRVLSDSSTRQFAVPKLNDIVSILYRFSICDAVDDLVSRQEIQQLFTTVWLLSPSSKKLASTFGEVLPLWSVDIESLHLLRDLLLTLGKLPADIYFDGVLKSTAALFNQCVASSNTNVLACLSTVLFSIYDSRENSDSFAAESVEQIHDYSLQEFHSFFRSEDWSPIFSYALRLCRKSLKEGFESSESIHSLRIVSWIIISLPHESTKTFAEDMNLFFTDVIDFFSSATGIAEKQLDFLLFCFTDILVAFYSCQECPISDSLRKLLFDNVFQLTMSRSHSLYQSYALSKLLQIHPDEDQSYLSTIFDDEGTHSFCVSAATSLANGTFWERVNILRTLSFISHPVVQSIQVEDGISSQGKVVDVIRLLIELTSLPTSLKNEREISRRFETLEVLCRGSKLSKSFLSIIAGFCLGMFRTKFKPVWASASAVLVTIAQHDEGEVILWPFLETSLNKYGFDYANYNSSTAHNDVIFGEKLESLWDDKNHDHIVLSLRNTVLFPFLIGISTQKLTVAPDSVADVDTTFLQLLNLLTQAVLIPIKRSKFVVGVFIRFLSYYYSEYSTEVEIPFLTGIGLLDKEDLCLSSEFLSRKSLRGRLLGFLKMFAAIPGPKQLHKHHMLFVYFNELLCKADIEVSKIAFDCVCNYKPSFLVPYKERLKNLLDDRKFRNETLEISSSLSSKEEPIFASEHQSPVFLFMVRILYGLLLSKPTTSRKEKDAIKSKRTAIFSFVAQLGSESAECLTYFMLRGLLPSQILEAIPVSFVDQRTNVLDIKMSEALILNIHSHVLKVLQSNSTINFDDASWDRLKGYLYSLQPAFSNIGFVMTSMVPLVYKTLYMIIQLCTKVKAVATKDEDIVDADEVDEQNEDNSEAETDVKHIVEMKVSSECRTLAMRRITEMLDQYNQIYDFSDGKIVLLEGLSPLLSSLPSALHSSHKTPTILLLLHRLSQYPCTVSMFVHYHELILDNCISCLSISKLQTESARILTQIFQAVMDFSGSLAFLPYAERIVSMFVRRLQGPTSDENAAQLLKLSDIDATSLGGVREEVDLLCRIATEVFVREDVSISATSATNFATIVLGILRSYSNSPKSRISEEWVTNMLAIYRSFLRRVDNVASHVSFFSRMFGPSTFANSHLNAAKVRSELLITYSMLCDHPSVSAVLSTSMLVLTKLMKQDRGIVDSRDFGSFVPFVQALSTSDGAILEGTHVSWSYLIGPKAYSRKGEHITRSISEHASICSAVLFEIIRCLYDSEMAVRTSASIATKTLISEASSWVSEHSKDWACIFHSFIIPALRKGIQQSSDIVKEEFLSIFSHYVGVAAANQNDGALFCDHIDLAFLRNDEKDQDFFHNITHIQVHRRARAFLRLHRILREPTNAHSIGISSFVHILLPISMYYITNEEFTKKAHQNVIEEVTQLIGAICLHLPWNHYMNVFRKTIRLLQKADPTRLKLMQTIVCIVLDSFHFSLNQTKPEESNSEGDAVAVEDNDDEDQNEVEAVVEEKAIATSTSGNKIVQTVVNQILPTVKQFLLRGVKDHKGNKTEEVQTNIAVALTNLLLHLEPPAVTEEERMTLFSSLVIKVVNTLKSRDSNIRDAARQCLAKMINILGLAALRPVVYELKSNLREGFQRHVAAYSLRTVLMIVLENYQATDMNDDEELQALVDGSKAKSDGEVQLPPFDQALDLIMEFVLEDISSDMKEDRESEGALRTVIREQKGSKFREILEIISRCLLFRPTYALRDPTHPQAVSSIHAVSMPLLEALQAGEDSTFSGRVTEALTQVATGLSKNASIRDKELLLYVHATLQPFVTQMLAEYRRYQDALGKLAVSSKKAKSVSAEDDSDFEIDLPSYLREDNSDDEEKFEFMREGSHKKNSDNDPNSIDKQKAATWLPSDARSLKDQRAVIEARNLEQKERVRVQDGASAPKLTGRNRYDLAHRKGKNAAGISKVTLVAIKFCLTLLQSSIKRGIFVSNNLEVQAMMVPFIPLLRSFLHIPNASEVVALSIKVIGSLVNWGVPLDAHMHARLTNRILLIMIRHCATISSENELCQACIKSLVAMFKHFNDKMHKYEQQLEASNDIQRATKELERPKFPLDELKLRSLVEMLTISITDIASSFQNPAFQLIKEIIRSRVLLPEIYDLIKKLTEQIVLSHRKGIRETSSQIVIQFMITYPMGNKRAESQLVQLLNNCSYEYEEGRCSAMETIFHILKSFPVPVIEEHAYRFFFPMTLKLVNETSRVCRDWAVQILSILLRRILNIDLLQQFQDFAMKWLSTIVTSAETAHQIWSDETTAVVRTGAQVMSIFARSRVDLSSRAEIMKQLLEVTFSTLSLLRKAESDELEELKEQGKSMILPRYWHTVYHVVLMLEQVYATSPTATDNAIAQFGASSDLSGIQDPLPLMEQIMDMVLYRHMWVRSSAARLLSAYFQRRPPQRKNLVAHTTGYDLFMVPNICYQLARKICILLNQPSELSSTLLDTLGQNLAYVVQVLVFHPELDTYAPKIKDEEEEEIEDKEEEEDDEEDFPQDHVDDEDVVELSENEDDDNDNSGVVDGQGTEEETAEVPEGGLAMTKVGLSLVATTSAPQRIPGTTELKQGKRKRENNDEDNETELLQVNSSIATDSRSGLTWIMHRLRAIGADVRGHRRWHVVRCLQVILQSQVLSAELLEKFAELLMEPLIRVISSAQTVAQLLASEAASGRDTTAMEEQQKEQMGLHVLAKDLLQLMEDQLTPTLYLELFTKVQTKLQRIKSMKKQNRKAMAVSNPERFNKMRLENNQRKKFGKKRRIQEFKDKRGGIRKKMRR